MQARGESTVLLHVTHNHLKARFPEIRLDLHVRWLAWGVRCRRGARPPAAHRPRARPYRPLSSLQRALSTHR